MQNFRALYRLLDAQVPGSSGWWPADSRFEIVVGAILTQNTNWGNVERALAGLSAAGALTPKALLRLPDTELKQLIRPAGYYNTKAGYLREITEWFLAHDAGTAGLDTEQLRSSLLAVRGVGDETADDIVLYVYERPVFIYDLYARRLLAAAGFGQHRSYAAAKRALDPRVAAAGFSARELAHLHGLIVDAGKIARGLGGWDAAYPLLVSGDFGKGAG